MPRIRRNGTRELGEVRRENFRGGNFMFIGLVTAGVITVSIVVTLSHLSENYGYNRLGLLVRALIPLTTIGAIAYIIYALWGLFL